MQDDTNAPVQPATVAEAALKAAFAIRAQRAMDKVPALFRSERGRIQDFAKNYGLSRQTTAKILDGEVLPGLPLLAQFSKDTSTSMDYLLGLSEHETIAEVGAMLMDAAEESAQDARDVMISLPLFELAHSGLKQHGSISLPRWTLPLGLWESDLLVVRWASRTAEQYLQPGSFALVQLSALPADGSAHLALWNGNRAEALHVTSQRGGSSYLLTTFDGRTEVQDGQNTVFGLKDDTGALLAVPFGTLQVLGPIVGRLEVTERGVRVASPQANSNASAFVGLSSV